MGRKSISVGRESRLSASGSIGLEDPVVPGYIRDVELAHRSGKVSGKISGKIFMSVRRQRMSRWDSSQGSSSLNTMWGAVPAAGN